MKSYDAPWSTSLVVISSLATLICFGIAMSMVLSRYSMLKWLAILPVALIGAAALFTIRGYAVTPDAIVIRRLFWTTKLPLTDLQSAEFRAGAMTRSIRTFGNGGL